MSDLDEPLSEREIEILQKVATGASNKEIAAALVISPNTVKVHLRNIFTKIGVASRTEATLYAIKHNLVAQPNQVQVFPDYETPEVVQKEVFEGSPLALISDGPLSTSIAHTDRFRPGRIFWILTALILVAGIALTALFFSFKQPLVTAVQPTQPAPSGAPIPASSRWTQEITLPGSRFGMGTFFYNGLFYVAGGDNGTSVTADVYSLDNQVKSWVKLKSKPTATEGMRAIMIGERAYFPGGKTANGFTSEVMEVYNPRLNVWTSKKSLPVGLSDYAATAFEGQIYIFGGKSANAYSNQVLIYNPQTDAWNKGSNLPSGRAFASAEVFEGKILIMGGFDGKNSLTEVLAYNPTRDTADDSPWEQGPVLPAGRYGMSSTSLANNVYLFGGKGAAGSKLPSLILQPQFKTWVEISMPEMPMAFQGSAQPAGNFIHLFGGILDSAPLDMHLSYQAIYTISLPLTNTK